MLEKWKSTADNKKTFCKLLTDLLKKFDCFSHDLLVAKLNASRFNFEILSILSYFLPNCKEERIRASIVQHFSIGFVFHNKYH